MAKLKDVVKFLDKYLGRKGVKDTSCNGLQVKGKSDVSKIAFTENASLDTFKMALAKEADLIVVHHGLFWKGNPNKNIAMKKVDRERVKLLGKNKVSLYASHLPLDKHRIVGNNAQLLKLLGAKEKSTFAKFGKFSIGLIGEFRPTVPISRIVKILNRKLKTKCRALLFGPKKIRTIAVCSGGGGSSVFYEALRKKVDLYLTGEISERYTSAKDAKFNVIFAGHYATETVGVKALMKVVKKKFKVKTIFIDDPTGL